MAKEMIFQRHVLTKAWDEIEEKDPCFFDTVNTYPKKYHIDGMKDGPIGWEDDPCTVEDVKEMIEDETCSAILSNKKDKLLVVVQKTLPAVLVQGKTKQKIPWEDYAKYGVWAIKRNYPDYKLDAVVINPKIKTLEELGVLKSMIKQVLAEKDLVEGGKNEPARKPNRKDQAGPAKERLEDGRDPFDPHACE